MDEELMEIIRQLEEDIDSSEIGSGDNKKPSAVASDDSTEDKKEKLVQLVEEEDEDSEEVAEIKEILRALREEEEAEEEPVEEGEDEEEVDIKEVLRALREEEEETVEEAEEAEEEKEVAEAKLREAYAVISFLRSKINEVNLLNSKLLFSNKLFRKHSLSEKQKMSVIENFDRASSLREVKLVYTTLSESFRTTKVKPIKESFASKPTASTRPSKPILNEGDDMANRLRKLAGLK
jgi:vacuolar-type H+-ATPase subunit I/STV1